MRASLFYKILTCAVLVVFANSILFSGCASSASENGVAHEFSSLSGNEYSSFRRADDSLDEHSSGVDFTTNSSSSWKSEWSGSKEDIARSMICKAFSCDISEYTILAESEDGKNSITFTSDGPDRYLFEYYEDLEYPTTIYHFSKYNDADFDLSNEPSEYFNPDMIDVAKNFIYNLYGIDCENATVSAFGYKNKISVQVQINEQQIFHVRFYYKDPSAPVGIMFVDDEKTSKFLMDANNAKQYM